MYNLIIRDGTSQAMRALPALQDGYFHLDELSFHELLAIVTEFASLVRFHNAENVPEGDWTPFFRADETVVMSRILAFDLARETARFAQWWRNTPEHVGVSANGESSGWTLQASPVTELVITLNDWYVALAQAQSDNGLGLRTVLRAVIVQLSVDRSGILGALRAVGGRVPLDPIWSAGLATPGMLSASQPGDPDADGIARAGARLTKADVRTDFHAYMKAIEMVRKEALARLPASLHNGIHDPAIGLLIAFVQQFQKLQGKLNGYTRRFIDFYYDRMLGSAPRATIPDHTWLVFKRTPDARDVVVPAGTEFPAGVDVQSRDILYVADSELRVSDAGVAQVQTLYLDHNGYSAPENLLADDDTVPRGAPVTGRTWPTAAWFQPVPVAPPGADHTQAWPVLGAPKAGMGSGPHRDARIGFALSSKVLLLKEGDRRISVTITFADDTLMQRLDRVADAMLGTTAVSPAGQGPVDVDDGPAAVELRRNDIFLKIFRSIFVVGLTGEFGWIDIPGYVPFYDDGVLRLSFELPPESPSVVAYSPALHGEQFDVDTPLLRCVINPGAYLFPYGMLRDLAVTGARIDVEARGCRDLVLHNNIGQLSAATPFAPFGPLARLGSYLIVGSTEMASKRITDFRVEIEWADLPRVTGGFGAWYDGYDVRLANEDYLATVAVLAKGVWTPASELARPSVPMFRTRVQPGQGERIDTRIVWRAGQLAHLFEPDAGVSAAQPLTWGPGAKNGFFKFTFAAPAFAFGHERYAQALSTTMMANARRRRWRGQRAVPRAPYTPLVNAISVDYCATGTIRVDRLPKGDDDGRFLHLYPSGWETLGLKSYPAPALLPRFEAAGNLYVGIAAGDLGKTLTLLFELREDSQPVPPTNEDTEDGPADNAGLRWSYLTNNVWKPLPRRDIVADGTRHFMTSGIVTLRVPGDIGCRNTVMPDGLYWLRVSADRDMEKYCSLYAIHAQAVQVHRGADVPPEVPMVLPAGSIARSRRPLPGITAIVQPLPSYGGRAAETREQMRTRISERLRHKQRAISPADYESLILEAFADVYKVKCFANLTTANGPFDCVRPGHALIVPLPYWPALQADEQMPMLDGNLMQEIAAYVNTLSSPWAHVSVENPVYERIQVRCKVRFSDVSGNGRYIAMLNAAISHYLTPWQDGVGYRTHFGWRIRQHDLEAFIGSLPYVQNVSGFSMLRIAAKPPAVSPASATSAAAPVVWSSADVQTYSLFDTADPANTGSMGGMGGMKGQTDITPLYPWSIAIPVARHAIEAVDDGVDYPGVPTALSRLEIGATFIISDDPHDQ